MEVAANTFRCTVAWAKYQSIKVQACSDLTAPAWQDVDTYLLTNGTCWVTDPEWADSPLCGYRITCLNREPGGTVPENRGGGGIPMGGKGLRRTG